MCANHEQRGSNMIKCLKCGSSFLSWDRRKNRVCKRCNSENDLLLRFYTPEALGIERRASAVSSRRSLP
jgi:hypothetical protein